jgi:hypothetical protein
MGLYPDVRQIVDPKIFSEPRMVPNLEIPGEFDSQTGLDVHAFTNLRTEQAQQSAPKPR